MGVTNGRYRYGDLNFRYFNSMNDLFEQTKEAQDKIKEENAKRLSNNNFYTINQGSRADQTKFKKKVDYEDKPKLFKLLDELETAIEEIEMGGETKKDRMIITSDERGIFSFGLASRGLFRPVEYFSQELADEMPNLFKDKPSGIVPNELVQSIKIFNEIQFWYEEPDTKKRYQLTQQQEGTREVNLGNKKQKVFRTTTKKSYVLFPKKTGKARLVDIYIPLHQDIKLEHIIPILLVIKYLQKQNIATRIVSTRMVLVNGERVVWSIPVKEYEEDVDYNKIALRTEDNDWWKAVANAVRTIRNWESKSINGKEYGGYEVGGESDYNDIFSRYKNWYFQELDKGNLPPLRIDKKLILFGRAYNRTKEGMITAFFKMLDTVDLQFNKEEKCFQKIYRRQVTRELDIYYSQLIRDKNVSITEREEKIKTKKKQLTQNFRNYVIKLLTDTYLYPEDGNYAEIKENIIQYDKEYDQKIEKLIEFLNTI